MKRRIISAGLPKTGTRSLIAALELLGYSHSGDAFQRARLERWCSGDLSLDPGVDVQDEPAFGFADELARANPDALIIVTLRPWWSWIKSVERNLAIPHRLGPKLPRRLELESMLEARGAAPSPTRAWLLGLYGGGWSLTESHNAYLGQVTTIASWMAEPNVASRLLLLEGCEPEDPATRAGQPG